MSGVDIPGPVPGPVQPGSRRPSGVLVAASILDSDLAALGDEIRRAEDAGADRIHLDVMDGHFVPNITFGWTMVGAVRAVTSLPFDAHLMISEPGRWVDRFLDAGCDSITFHVEVDPPQIRPALERIREAGRSAGLSVKPGTPLAALDAYRGRPRAGLARLDALARELPEVERDAVYHALRADYLLGLDDLAGVRAEVAATRRLDPALGAEHAVSLAWLGDVDEAEALARELPAGLPLARTTAALVRLRRGDAAGGLDALRRAAAELPVVAWRVAPLFLLGEQLARSGRDAEAVDVLRRAGTLYEPLSIWRSWAYPRGQVLAARSLARLGRTEEARATLDRLLASAPDPEPDCRWVAEARALRARLAVH